MLLNLCKEEYMIPYSVWFGSEQQQKLFSWAMLLALKNGIMYYCYLQFG